MSRPTGLIQPAWPSSAHSFAISYKGRTVFISSHLLDEIEKVCDVAAIVRNGRIVANGPISELVGGGSRSRLRIETDRPDEALAALRGLVDSHRQVGPRTVELIIDADQTSIAAVNRRLVNAGVDVVSLDEFRPTLEVYFLELTATGGAER